MKTLTDEKGKTYFLIPKEQFCDLEKLEDFLDLQIARSRRSEPTKNFRKFYNSFLKT